MKQNPFEFIQIAAKSLERSLKGALYEMVKTLPIPLNDTGFDGCCCEYSKEQDAIERREEFVKESIESARMLVINDEDLNAALENQFKKMRFAHNHFGLRPYELFRRPDLWDSSSCVERKHIWMVLTEALFRKALRESVE